MSEPCQRPGLPRLDCVWLPLAMWASRPVRLLTVRFHFFLSRGLLAKFVVVIRHLACMRLLFIARTLRFAYNLLLELVKG